MLYPAKDYIDQRGVILSIIIPYYAVLLIIYSLIS
jgi:hypothetical protein